MKQFENIRVVITGGTDGIGAASALELCGLGADVLIIGRSEAKAELLKAKAQTLSGKFSYIIGDFSLLKNVAVTAGQVAEMAGYVDIIIHAVGILITKPEHTGEGIEKDFAVSYLSRFFFNELLFGRKKFTKQTKILNIAASSPKVPSFAQMEFNNLAEVMARVGMKSHGQAQLANDLYTAFAGQRYSVIAIGYGPGSVDTNIRRELPKLIRYMMKPFFYFSTRSPEEVARQLVAILAASQLQANRSYFFNKAGEFIVADFVNNTVRQNDLLQTTLTIINQALKGEQFV